MNACAIVVFPVPLSPRIKVTFLFLSTEKFILQCWNCLKLNNDDAIEELIGKVEIEYYYDEDKVKDLLINGSIDEFLDCLDFAPSGVIDLVKNLAVTLKLNDYTKREAILEKTGFDVTKAIEINKATEEIKQEKTNITRRVKEETQEVTEKPVRRTLSSTKK